MTPIFLFLLISRDAFVFAITKNCEISITNLFDNVEFQLNLSPKYCSLNAVKKFAVKKKLWLSDVMLKFESNIKHSHNRDRLKTKFWLFFANIGLMLGGFLPHLLRTWMS